MKRDLAEDGTERPMHKDRDQKAKAVLTALNPDYVNNSFQNTYFKSEMPS